MRTLKFRAWDNEKKLMFVPNPISGDMNQFFHLVQSKENGFDFELMQFTGLFDKNGKEIYEGDIVNEFRLSRSYPNGRDCKHVIKWEEDMTLDDSYGMQAVGFCLYGGVLEVIGNIYENPELLTPTQSDQT